MLTAVKPRPQSRLISYLPQTHVFKVTLTNRFEEECTVSVKTDSDRFCNVICAIRAQYPGWAIVDSWEVA